MTGWERYARCVASLLIPMSTATVRITDPTKPSSRFRDDWLAIPKASSSSDLRHFLTMPPAAPSRIPTITTIHDLAIWKYPETTTRMAQNYYKPLYERALQRDAIVTVSESMKAEIEDYFSVVDVGVIPNVVDDLAFTNTEPYRGNRPYFICLGSIEPRKNIARLVEAFARSGVATEVDLKIVGRRAWGELPRMADYIEAPSDAELRSLIKGARALFFPSLYEGFGLPIIEAQAAGTPVYCSDLAVFHEVGGPAISVFDPLDIESIAESLRTAASDRESDRIVGRPAPSFTRDRCRRAIRETYRKFGVDLDDSDSGPA
ncbi:glycosyltransferase family 4 protein [Rhodococcoides kroppenstedtii]|uniref:glycosyltransferase family 4 protein n=1 Tax=Rhodococcoides kroppenstedtii TaxID=293050 RepID=UPI001BDECD10|nr:glycosyltransferase family 1 protein [Rhodococcus kroppenstedtii]MBT1191100.1 glycosyltransferase family 4 protein [Rhodococcus kroppenstedtii]